MMKGQRYRALVITVVLGVIFIILVGLAIILLARDGGDPAPERDGDVVGRVGGAGRDPAPVVVAIPAASTRPVHLILAGRAT